MSWKEKEVTEPQMRAIINMSSALGDKIFIPETRGAASDKIAALKEEITRRVDKTGMIRQSHFYDGCEDEYDWDDTFGHGSMF